MSYLWGIDNDLTVFLGDMGRDYLCSLIQLEPEILLRFYPEAPIKRESSGLITLDSSGFWKVVEGMRKEENSEYRDGLFREIYGDFGYEKGLELALLLAYSGASEDAVRESGKGAGNSLREGFAEFLHDTERGRVVIFSAGAEEWLKKYYDRFPNTNFDVVGTSLYTNENGQYSRIKKPCGRGSKHKRVEDVLQGMNGGIIKIGVGDSDGDREMFDYILGGGGFTIGFGDAREDIEGDINLSKDDTWYPARLAGGLFAYSRGAGPDIRKSRWMSRVTSEMLESIRANTENGKEILSEMKKCIESRARIAYVD